MREQTIGIDLGTTNSVVASTDRGGEPRVLPDEHDEKIHPSVVSFHPNGTVIVGAVAKQRRVIDPANTVYSVKRLIGRPYSSPEVQAAKTRMPFQITQGSNEQPVIHTRGGQFAIPEISAIVLDHMRSIAKRAQRSDRRKAVITVPANFSEGQRSATATAGAISGLEVIQILNEPTAAALAYGHRKNLDRLIAVYDFGGGTFDITLLQIKKHLYEVLATAGNSFLGGDDIDETLVEHMVELFLRQDNVDLRGDDLAMMRLRSVAEQIKIQLSRRSRAIVRIDEIAYGPGGRGLDLNLEINREELVARCAHVVDRTFPVCDEALKLAGIARDTITDIVLVGGTTKMPYVRQRATQYFGNQPRVDVNPDEAVALGAALQADIIAHELAGEPIRRRAGSIGSHSEVTRVDPAVHQRVAEMIKETERRRASAPSSSVIIGDEDGSFADDFTDGSGIFISVDAETGVASETRTTPKTRLDDDWNTDSGVTDEGWDAPTEWPTLPESPALPPGARASEVTVNAGSDTNPQFGDLGRTTDRGVAMPRGAFRSPMPASLPGPADDSAQDLPTITREAERLEPLGLEERIPLEPMGPAPAHSRTSPPAPYQAFSEPDISDPVLSPPPPPRPPPVPAASPMAKTMFEPGVSQQPLAAAPTGPQLYDPRDLQRRGNPMTQTPSETNLPPLYDPRGLQGRDRPMPDPPPPQQRSAPPPRPIEPPRTMPPIPQAPRAAPDPFPPPPSPFQPPAQPPPSPFQPPAQPPPSAMQPPPTFASPAQPLGPAPSPADSLASTQPVFGRPAVSQYGLPELGSKPFTAPMVKDVTSYALGIGTVGGFCESLVGRNTPVPHETSRRFSTSHDMQTTVRIKVFQGESRRLDENRRLGDLVLNNLAPRPRGDTSIDVSFILNQSGMLEVHAVDVATGYQQSASIEILGAQSPDEIAASQERMRKMFQ